VLRERGQGRELLRSETAHDVGGVASSPLVAQRKTFHGGHVWGRIGGTVQLERDVLELVRRINGELPLVDRAVGHVETRPVLVAIRVVAPADSPELRNVSHQQTEHVIERSILKHQDDDVLDARVRRPAASLRPH
jgi:hypothetical protein